MDRGMRFDSPPICTGARGGYSRPSPRAVRDIDAEKWPEDVQAMRGDLVPAIGFELMTYRLQGGCSTN